MVAPPKSPLRITIFVDNRTSWIIPFAERLKEQLGVRGHHVSFVHEKDEVPEGDILFLLSCDKIVPESTLARNMHNIVVHPSDLPKGRGFSPLTWLILGGANNVPVTLFEAVKDVDAGPFYFKDVMQFEGHELNDELKAKQGEKTIEMVLKFVDTYPDIVPYKQEGKATWYHRRTSKDSELDLTKSIGEQFELLRVVDNERYPAFFMHRGHRYILRIEKSDAKAE